MKKVTAIITCFGGSPSPPKAAAPAPVAQDAGVITARDNESRRRRAVAGNTVLTSSMGLSGTPTVATKTLLGS